MIACDTMSVMSVTLHTRPQGIRLRRNANRCGWRCQSLFYSNNAETKIGPPFGDGREDERETVWQQVKELLGHTGR